MTRICAQCGSGIGDDHDACPSCLLGEALIADTVQCIRCQNELADGSHFCSQCGAPAPLAEVKGDAIQSVLAERLKGQYRIVRLLGRGGMGSVYLARDLGLDREVAIKVVKTDADSRDVHERFRREARMAAKLAHPNIVPLHAFGDVDGMPYAVMGYVRGESLARRLRREGRLPEDDARRIAAEVAGALDHAHRQGVVHRDVKPDNVLIDDESGRALLTDFGVAKSVGGSEMLTREGGVVGTPQYMSPEQVSGRSDIDGRTDIYSLGVMAYTMLSGRLPFDGNTAADILAKQISQEPASLATVAPDISDATVQAVQRCLAKEPSARWPDARSLSLALGSAEEVELPDALHAIESRGALAAMMAGLFAMVFVLMQSINESVPFAMATVMVGYGLMYAVFVYKLRREGFPSAQVQRIFWREPKWWPWWYPQALRRPGNVWRRVPGVVRRLRWTLLVLIIVPSVYVPLRLHFDRRSAFNFYRSPAAAIEVLVLLLIVAIWAGFAVYARRQLSRAGLAPGDAFRVMYTIPASRAAFWARPHVAVILAPESAQSPRQQSPNDYLQSIRRDADQLSGPLRPLAAEAAAAARELVDAIDAGGKADELRGRRLEMLKTLSLEVASLRVVPQADRVRALCEEIRRPAPASDDHASLPTIDRNSTTTLDRVR